MRSRGRGSVPLLVLGLVAMLVLVAACAKSGDQAAAPAPSPAPAKPGTATPSVASPAPAAPAAPAKPAPSTASVAVSDAPKTLVPGGPLFYRAEIEKLSGWKVFEQYHPNKYPLWTRAKYGGMPVGPGRATQGTFNALIITSLGRPSSFGMLMYIDMGLCSMVGRDDDFSRCNGQYAHNDDMVILPGIFQRWEQTDAVSYVFRMRPGVLWPAAPPMNRTDRSVTAQDIVWFLETVKREGALKDNFTSVKTFEAVDRSTVRVTLLEPHADFLLAIAHTSLGLISKECFEEKDCLNTKLISPGPFLIKENNPGTRVVWEKNAEFYLKGMPYNDGRILVPITDPAAIKAAFITGQIHTFAAQNLEEMRSVLKQRPDFRVHAQSILAGNHALRVKMQGPMADVRVRRAMAMTLDMPSLFQIGYGGATLFPTLVARHYFGAEFYLSLEQAGPWYQFNPEKAKQLMAEAGYANGFSTSIEEHPGLIVQKDMLLYMATQWKKLLNVEAKIVTLDGTTHTANFQRGNWDTYFWWCWNVTCWADVDASLTHFLTGAKNNPQGISDPWIDDLYKKQRGELDPAKRVKLLWDFEQYELDKVYFIRMSVGMQFMMSPPWEMNGVSHQVAYFNGLFNGPGWLSMIDTDLQKAKQR